MTEEQAGEVLTAVSSSGGHGFFRLGIPKVEPLFW